MIKKETTMKTNFENTALNACFQLHNELLNDDAFAGYEGDKDAFDKLYKEVYTITRYELFDGAEVDQVIETFFTYTEEIANGEREVDWFEYV